MKKILVSLIILVSGLTSKSVQGKTVFVEAEGFQTLGGWKIDQQFMDQMGSPFLLAHGLGRPVADAVTAVEFPAVGKYNLWVRTRDWAAPWKKNVPPGQFQLIIDGKAVKTTFGTEGSRWHWQNGGEVDINSRRISLAIHDITGFDGRCDAIIFTTEKSFQPPSNGEELTAFRRKQLALPAEPELAGSFDFVVVGGGMAGTCAAISASRLGLKTALIQNRPVLGGNNSSEVRVHLNGRINLPPYPALGNLVRELDPGYRGNAQPAYHYNDTKKLQIARAEKNLHLFLNTHAYKLEKSGNRITAVIARNIRTNREYRFLAPLFADCTGDGNIGYLAGADYRMGRESRSQTGESLAPKKPDKMTMGTSIQWYAEKTDAPVSFPECPWALQFDEKTCQKVMRGDWDWETGMNLDQIKDFEQIRDHGMRVVFGNWSYLKNHSREKQKYANWQLRWVAYIGGKRESRRLLGDVICQQQDIQEFIYYPDAMVTTSWSIDLHYPNPENARIFHGNVFRSIARFNPIKPYPIPYRCLYSRNIANLFMAGRDISVTHVALGTVRVMRTGGMMGEVLGMAASICTKHHTTPRGVYQNHLEELKSLARKGVGRILPTTGKASPANMTNK